MTRREEEEDLDEALVIVAEFLSRTGNHRVLENDAVRASIVRAVVGRRRIRKKLEAGMNVGSIGDLATELAELGFPPIARAPLGTTARSTRRSTE